MQKVKKQLALFSNLNYDSILILIWYVLLEKNLIIKLHKESEQIEMAMLNKLLKKVT